MKIKHFLLIAQKRRQYLQLVALQTDFKASIEKLHLQTAECEIDVNVFKGAFMGLCCWIKRLQIHYSCCTNQTNQLLSVGALLMPLVLVKVWLDQANTTKTGHPAGSENFKLCEQVRHGQSYVGQLLAAQCFFSITPIYPTDELIRADVEFSVFPKDTSTCGPIKSKGLNHRLSDRQMTALLPERQLPYLCKQLFTPSHFCIYILSEFLAIFQVSFELVFRKYY